MPELAPKPTPGLALSVQHRRGTFMLDADLSTVRWPALLFGPSGAGKSSLLRIIAGLDKPDAGRITLNGQVLVDASRGIFHRAGSGTVQLVAQKPALFPHLTVRENVAFGIRHLPSEERRARVGNMLRLLGAQALADRRTARLSGGERRRVALARALAPAPQLLLLDEAFSGLDLGARQEILAELGELFAAQGVLALHVTHEIAEAFAIDAEVLVMRGGRVIAQGPAEEVLADERTRLLHLLGHKSSG